MHRHHTIIQRSRGGEKVKQAQEGDNYSRRFNRPDTTGHQEGGARVRSKAKKSDNSQQNSLNSMSKYVDAPTFKYQETVKQDPLATYKLPFKTKEKV